MRSADEYARMIQEEEREGATGSGAAGWCLLLGAITLALALLWAVLR